MTVRPPDRGYIVKGWCPAPGRPMESGDGWLLRLKPFGGILTAQQAAAGLFGINLAMLLAFMAWGLAMPRLVRSGLQARHVIAWALPGHLLMLLAIVVLGTQARAPHWAAWCVLSSCVTLSQPAIAQAFAPALAGRALSAFNLVVFAGVFCVQWIIGAAVDALVALGVTRVGSFRIALSVFGVCCALAQAWFLVRQRRMTIIGRETTTR